MAKRIGEKLMEAGLVSAEAIDQALQHQKITGGRLGDCLVDLGLVQEAVLLRFLAQEYQTRFVTAAKLASVKIPADVLDKVPVRVAEAQDVLPIGYDAERKVLSVVMAEPQKQELVTEIALVTEMNEVFPMIGMRSAIRAAIRKHYYGDPTAFAALEAGGPQPMARPSAPGSSPSLEPSRIGPAPSDRTGISSPGGKTSSRRQPHPAARDAGRGARQRRRERLPRDPQHPGRAAGDAPQGVPRALGAGGPAVGAHRAAHRACRPARWPTPPSRPTCTTWAREPDKHFTLPLLSLQSDAKAEAKRYVRAPIKLFETVHLHGGVNTILAQLYEFYDGTGVPQGVKGEDIAAGARIIAAVDAFFDLTRNPFNVLGRVMPKTEALPWMRDQGGMLFDPVVIDALVTLQSGDLLRQRMENDGRQIFVADPDEGRAHRPAGLAGQAGPGGADGAQARRASSTACLQNEADTVVVGLAYGVGDIVALAQFVRARPESASLPIIVLGDPTDAQSKERLVQAGVTAFVPLPINPDPAATLILNAYLDRTQHGGPGHVVRGSFDEFPPADLARLLGGSRKSGRLQVRNGPQEGHLLFERGRVVFATFADKKGDAAMAALFSQPQAEFQYDPEVLLAEMPNIERDLEVLARQLEKAPPPPA